MKHDDAIEFLRQKAELLSQQVKDMAPMNEPGIDARRSSAERKVFSLVGSIHALEVLNDEPHQSSH